MVAEHVGDYKVLRDGVKMPWFGLGVWQGKPMDGPEIENAIRYAIEAGKSIPFNSKPGVRLCKGI